MNKYWVVDTNILITALLQPSSDARKALIKARESGILLISEELKKEYLNVLSRKKFDKYISLETRLELYVALCDEALEIIPTQKITLSRDIKDNMILELALEAQADAIISIDNDLLVLNPFSGIPIVSDSVFLNRF